MDSSATATSKTKSQQGGVKDTIESILVAFILAFIFRAFIVEAFVIPTGSMAPTLMGAHMRFTCPDCGYKWTVNFSSTSSGDDDISIPGRAVVDVARNEGGQRKITEEQRVLQIFCPNCGYRLPRTNKDDPDNSATAPPVYYGDRILVLKYLYLFSAPQRWDVVVFKSPSDPQVHNYTQNFIKRLIATPNECVMVLDGDIYIGKPGDKREQFQIQTKPRAAQEALWRVVYDNDYQPKTPGDPRFVTDARGNSQSRDPSWQQPWVEQQGGSGWTTGSAKPGDRKLTFSNLSGKSTLKFSPVAGALNFPLTDWLGYDVTRDQFYPSRGSDTYLTSTYQALSSVADLKLDLFYQRTAGTGPLRLSLSKIDDTFIAELLPDQVRLLQRHGNGVEQEIGKIPWTAPSHPAHVEFTNVDYKVTLRVDGVDLLSTTPAQYQPDILQLIHDYEGESPQPRPSVAITGDQQSATIEHVSLWRDVFYTNRAEPGSAEPMRWATPDHPQQLGPDEYFTMGDNSSFSYDARYWDKPIMLDDENLDVAAGRVPGRFMLGKAFFVYWPAGHRIKDIGLIPDFGDMRFIH